MSKKYVFLTPEIGNMGGAQMYVVNKTKYLQEEGWDIYVFYYIYGENIKLPMLKKYMDNCVHDFLYAYYYVPIYQQNKIQTKIAGIIGKADEIIVESHLLSLAYWGEMIAQKLEGRHIVNLLEEQFSAFTDKEFKFFDYKLKRWEFMNAGINTLKRVFKNRYNEEMMQYEHSIVFQCSNVVDEDIEYDGDFAHCDFTILSIGRLDKQYVLPMVKEIKRFAEQNADKLINVIFVGGSLDGSCEKNIPEMLQKVDNLSCHMLGYTFPVPINIIKMSDVAIASANSVLVTADYGIPTICVDMNDNYATGVFRYTTMNNFQRKYEPKIDISVLLNEVLIDGKFPKVEATDITMKKMRAGFEKQINFLDRSKGNSGYYDVHEIHGKLDTLYCNLKWWLHEGVGIK